MERRGGVKRADEIARVLRIDAQSRTPGSRAGAVREGLRELAVLGVWELGLTSKNERIFIERGNKKAPGANAERFVKI
ncbi:MAG: hypothetical protein HUK22_02805 [Thermoguttaceae bacterium]|nr:hypothetical protein [Thermoguttaceae bacterium]